MAENERDFKGIWIPKDVWLDDRLTALDKIILMEIDSLDNGEKGCYASNKYISDFCKCSESKVTKSVSTLIKYGYLYVQKFDGRQRELRSRLTKSIRQSSKIYEAECENLRQSNIDNNINNNINNNRSKKVSKNGYDAILSEIEDEELKELYLEYIKMRKMIKAPMTDRALRTLINKVNTLEPYDIERQKQLLENSIINNWKSVYPLKDDFQNNTTVKTKPNAKDELLRLYEEFKSEEGVNI